LWASVHIAIPDPRTSDEETVLRRLKPEAATEWLTRSGALPLYSGQTEHLMSNPEQCDWVMPYAEVRLPFANRWKTSGIAIPL
jgi:hypothetical protein